MVKLELQQRNENFIILFVEWEEEYEFFKHMVFKIFKFKLNFHQTNGSNKITNSFKYIIFYPTGFLMRYIRFYHLFVWGSNYMEIFIRSRKFLIYIQPFNSYPKSSFIEIEYIFYLFGDIIMNRITLHTAG